MNALVHVAEVGSGDVSCFSIGMDSVLKYVHGSLFGRFILLRLNLS